MVGVHAHMLPLVCFLASARTINCTRRIMCIAKCAFTPAGAHCAEKICDPPQPPPNPCARTTRQPGGSVAATTTRLTCAAAGGAAADRHLGRGGEREEGREEGKETGTWQQGQSTVALPSPASLLPSKHTHYAYNTEIPRCRPLHITLHTSIYTVCITAYITLPLTRSQTPPQHINTVHNI